MSDWTYPRKVKLVAIIWRDIIKGDLVLHDNQLKRVDDIVSRIVPEEEDKERPHIFELTFHDGTTLKRRWAGGEHAYAIFIRVERKSKWNIMEWRTS